MKHYLDDKYDTGAITRGLGEEWEIERVFFKPYPANHFTHAGIDAAIRLRERGLELGEIEEIDLGVAGPTLRTIAQPPEEKAAPKTGYAAQFSGPFTVATALVGGGGLGVGLDDFTDEETRDKEKLRLASLVECHENEECTRIFPNQFPAVLRVRLNNGETLEERVTHNRGGPEDPLSDEELAAKFRENAGRTLPVERVEELEARLHALERLENIEELTELLRSK